MVGVAREDAEVEGAGGQNRMAVIRRRLWRRVAIGDVMWPAQRFRTRGHRSRPCEGMVSARSKSRGRRSRPREFRRRCGGGA